MNLDELLAMEPEAAFSFLVSNPPEGVGPAVAEWIGAVVLIGVSARIPMMTKAVMKHLADNPPKGTFDEAELKKIANVTKKVVGQEVDRGIEEARDIAKDIRDGDPADDWKRGANHDDE